MSRIKIKFICYKKLIEFVKIIPEKDYYFHNETWGDGNGHSHLKATLIGPSLTIPFESDQILLGTWQQIIFIEFDNKPHKRDIIVQVTGE